MCVCSECLEFLACKILKGNSWKSPSCPTHINISLYLHQIIVFTHQTMYIHSPSSHSTSMMIIGYCEVWNVSGIKIENEKKKNWWVFHKECRGKLKGKNILISKESNLTLKINFLNFIKIVKISKQTPLLILSHKTEIYQQKLHPKGKKERM